MQFPSHVALQSPWQLNVPGLALQLASQPPVHDPTQFTSADAVHPPEHCASKPAAHVASTLTGVHLAVHPPDASTVQFALAWMLIFPQSERMSARAPRVATMLAQTTANAHRPIRIRSVMDSRIEQSTC